MSHIHKHKHILTEFLTSTLYGAFSGRAPAVDVISGRGLSDVISFTVHVMCLSFDACVCTHAAGRSVSVGRLVLGLNTLYEPSGRYSTC